MFCDASVLTDLKIRIRNGENEYMIEIHLMTAEHTYWKETISFAEKCSWKAGPFLAKKMKENEFKEWERVCAVCVDGKVAGFSTFTEKDELSEQYDFTPFIGFAFVDERYRGKRLSEMMIQSIISYAKELGYEKVYIMSGEIGLYEKYGFVKLGDYETIYGSVDQLFVQPIERANWDLELLSHLDKLHTTELGVVRIKRNLSLEIGDIVEWCKDKISSVHSITTRRGKNWYVNVDDIVITVNAYSYTIITAHRGKR